MCIIDISRELLKRANWNNSADWNVFDFQEKSRNPRKICEFEFVGYSLNENKTDLAKQETKQETVVKEKVFCNEEPETRIDVSLGTRYHDVNEERFNSNYHEDTSEFKTIDSCNFIKIERCYESKFSRKWILIYCARKIRRIFIVIIEAKNTKQEWRKLNNEGCHVKFETVLCEWVSSVHKVKVLMWRINYFMYIQSVNDQCSIDKNCKQRYFIYFREYTTTENSTKPAEMDQFQLPSFCECNLWQKQLLKLKRHQKKKKFGQHQLSVPHQYFKILLCDDTVKCKLKILSEIIWIKEC